jgi:hypothetical protein
MDDANARATGPRPSPGTCAAAAIARGDPACQAARTVHSCQPCTGRESDSPGPTSPHARCRSYRTGKRRLSLWAPARKNGPRAQAVRPKNSGPSPAVAICRGCGCRGPEQHLNITPRLRPKIGKPTPISTLRRGTPHIRHALPTRARRLGPTSPDHHPRHIGGSRATVVTSHRHATRLVFQRVSEPRADCARVTIVSVVRPGPRRSSGSGCPFTPEECSASARGSSGGTSG